MERKALKNSFIVFVLLYLLFILLTGNFIPWQWHELVRITFGIVEVVASAITFLGTLMYYRDGY